jgi:putative FmdB family regulatory protein
LEIRKIKTMFFTMARFADGIRTAEKMRKTKMPTYEYECGACGRGLEVFQSMKDDPLKKCPNCGKSRLKRKIGTGAGIIFKGSGFYCTDYRSPSYDKAAKSESGSSSGSPDSGSKTDVKTDAKTDKKPSGDSSSSGSGSSEKKTTESAKKAS